MKKLLFFLMLIFCVKFYAADGNRNPRLHVHWYPAIVYRFGDLIILKGSPYFWRKIRHGRNVRKVIGIQKDSKSVYKVLQT